MTNLKFLLSSIAIVASSAAAENLTDGVDLPEAVVTAPAKVRNVELLPLDVNVIDSTVIERSAESSLLPILVNQVPGLFVTERGFAGYGVSGGSAGAVNIRGVGQGNKVLFLIDGQPQWAGVFGHSLPDTYVANGVERVEVVKGPSSLLYGSNAMGGSVNIITSRAKTDGVSGRARAMFGSFTTEKFAVATNVRKGRFGASVSGQLDRSNGNRKGSEFWLANEFIQLQYSASDNWETGANVTMSQTKAHNPGTLQSPLENMWTNLQRGTASVYAKNHYGKVNGGVQGYINWGRNKVDDGNAPDAAPRDYLFNSTDYNMGFTIYETLNMWKGSDISLGVDFVHWGGHNWNTSKADPSQRSSEFREHENEVAGYVMAQQGFFGDILSVNAGVRLQHSSQYGNEWVPQAGFIVKPLAGSSVKFSFGKGFRAPNLRELYLYAPANPDLKPEYLYNYEVSLRQSLLGGRLNMGLALYYIDGKNMIQTQRIDGRPKNMNTGEFTNKGFEIDAAYAIDSRWSAGMNYSYLHTDRPLLSAPKNKLNAEVNFRPGDFHFTLESNTIWSLITSEEPLKKQDYSLLNLRAAYTMTSRVPVTYSIKVDNIFNKHYDIIYGCPMPGVTFMGGVEIKF
ncbi:TonB-dependent receptor [uncultured Muribaculum sp.]|uniref:TonB-dependent receptor plug domain-containing protein n=1 Tax=uncultured Muribaculum sp. TaxID=1918613 RepID=UPI0025938883|nr:TonB-dependent receptor [uncultured Muribaculum sp.]